MKKPFLIATLAIVAAFLFVAPEAFAAPAFVQSASSLTRSNNAQSEAFSGGTTAGNLIAVQVIWISSANNAIIGSVTDTHGDTFLPAIAAMDDTSSSPAQFSQIWYATNIGGGADTVSVNYTVASSTGSAISIGEYSGLATSSPIDATSTNLVQAASTTFNSGNVTTKHPNDLLFGGTSNTTATHICTAGTGYTQRQTGGNSSLFCFEDRTVSATGTYAATGTWGGAVDNAAFLVAFSASSTNTAMNANAPQPHDEIVTMDW